MMRSVRECAGALRGASFCGGVAGLPIDPGVGTPAGEVTPMIAVAAAFVAAAVWMFRRFGGSAAGEAEADGRQPAGEAVPAGA